MPQQTKKRQNSLNPYQTPPQTPKKQNSLNPYNESGKDVTQVRRTTGKSPRKFPFLPIVTALLAVLLVLQWLKPVSGPPEQTQPPKQTETVIQTQPPVQTQPPIQTQPPVQTEAPKPTEPPLVLVETSLLDLRPSSVDGTLYIFLSSGSAEDIPYAAHVTTRYITDNCGNSFRFSIHADGPTAVERSICYQLDGKYTRFCGQIVFLSFADNVKNNKPVQIYCDGQLEFSAYMSQYSAPADFDIDLQGVKVLKIVYPNSDGSNDQAAVCDAWLESYETP